MSEDKDHTRRAGPAIEKTYRFVLWVVPALEKFPRSQRFLLGDRIENTVLAVLEGLIEATYSKQVENLLRGSGIPSFPFPLGGGRLG